MGLKLNPKENVYFANVCLIASIYNVLIDLLFLCHQVFLFYMYVSIIATLLGHIWLGTTP